MRSFYPWISIVCLGTALCIGCSTSDPGPAVPLTAGEVGALLKRAKDPRHFWLTEYASDQGPFFANAHRLHPGQTAVLEFTRSDENLPVIEIQNRKGDSLRALLDTTSQENWMSIEDGATFEFTPLGPSGYQAFPDHVEDIIPGYAAAGKTIVFDTLHVETPVFYLRAARGLLWPLSRHPDRTDVRAVIGCNLLRVFAYAQIDFVNERLVLSSSREYTPNVDLILAETKPDWSTGALAVEGTINGEPVTFLIDSAGAYELALPEPDTRVIRHVGIGDLVFRNVQVEPLRNLGLGMPDRPRIGLRLLSQFNIVLDNRNDKLYIERPPL